MPVKPPSSAFPLLLSFAVLTLLIALFNHLASRPSHEEPLELTATTPNFRYQIATYRNPHGNRCALIRCGSPSATRTALITTCDLIHLTAITSKTNLSTRLCPVDYLYNHWDAISRTYNDGVQYVADNIVFPHNTLDLPTSNRAINFPQARNHQHLSSAWLTIFPSNATRSVIRAWYRAIPSVPKTATAPEQAALNRARNCQSPDVVCHPRTPSIRAQCDGLASSAASACITGSRLSFWIVATLQALTLLAAVFVVSNTVRPLLPRRHALSLIGVFGGLGARPILLELLGFICTIVVLIACIPRWPALVRVVARLLSVSATHQFDPRHLQEASEIYPGIPDLRGGYKAYVYIFADGAESVRISGPGTGLVVALVGFTFSVREAVEGGLLVRCLLFLGTMRLVSSAFLGVLGVSGRRRSDEDEYADRRTEAAFFRRGKERSRSFLLGKERGRVGF